MRFGETERMEMKQDTVECLKKKKIQTAKTHSHTKAEQMSGVQCGLNEP